MKLLLISFVLLIFPLSILPTEKEAPLSKISFKIFPAFEEGTLQLQIQNIQTPKGFMKIALFKGEETFLEDTAAYKTASVAVTNKEVMTTFSNLPYGVYAVAIYHDINGNNKLDKNLVGVPKEPYCFSNNARSKWGPPKFEVAKFSIDQPAVQMQVAVKKWIEQ